MTKPIGYWTNYTPGDGSYLEVLQQKYGCTFEKMNQREKLYLILAIVSNLCATAPGEVRSEITVLGKAIPENLSTGDQEGLISAIIEQVRNRNYSPADEPHLETPNPN